MTSLPPSAVSSQPSASSSSSAPSPSAPAPSASSAPSCVYPWLKAVFSDPPCEWLEQLVTAAIVFLSSEVGQSIRMTALLATVDAAASPAANPEELVHRRDQIAAALSALQTQSFFAIVRLDPSVHSAYMWTDCDASLIHLRRKYFMADVVAMLSQNPPCMEHAAMMAQCHRLATVLLTKMMHSHMHSISELV